MYVRRRGGVILLYKIWELNSFWMSYWWSDCSCYWWSKMSELQPDFVTMAHALNTIVIDEMKDNDNQQISVCEDYVNQWDEISPFTYENENFWDETTPASAEKLGFRMLNFCWWVTPQHGHSLWKRPVKWPSSRYPTKKKTTWSCLMLCSQDLIVEMAHPKLKRGRKCHVLFGPSGESYAKTMLKL